jgi:hypothetical protein
MRNRAHDNLRTFGGLLGCLVRSQGDRKSAAEAAAREGLIMKAASFTTSDDVMGGFDDALGGEFFTSLEHGSGVFDTIAQRSRRAALRTRAFIPTEPVIADIVADGLEIPASHFVLDGIGLEPLKAAALAVTTNEAAATGEGQMSLADELREAVTLAVDTAFLTMLAADAEYSDTLGVDPVADIKKLLDAVNTTGFGRLSLVCDPDFANTLCTHTDGGGLVFPDMAPGGGTACGVDVLVSAGAAGLLLIDATAILTGAESMQFKLSTSATINVDIGETPKHLSLFQLDAIGVIGVRHFAAKTIRPSGVGILLPGAP